VLTECSGKTAAYQIRKRLQTNEPKVMFLALGLLDMLMDKCATTFHGQIGTKDFMQVLILILNNKQIQQEVSQNINSIDPQENCVLDTKVGPKV
jgi:lipid A disaccharide synthetase